MCPNQRGFTLIEILTAILIIGVLVSFALPEYRVAVLKSRLSGVRSNVRSIADSMEVYYLSMGGYPTNSLTDADVEISGCTEDNGALSCRKGIAYDYGINQDDQPVGGFLGDSQGLAFIQYLRNCPNPDKQNKHECWADSANEQANHVCINMDGELIGTNSWRSDPSFGHSTAEWNVYRLPN